MAFQPDALPKGLNFEDNRWEAHAQADEIGFCAQCGCEYKATTLQYNRVHSGHAVCYRCLKRLRDGHTDVTEDDLAVAEETGTAPWLDQIDADLARDRDLPF